MQEAMATRTRSLGHSLYHGLTHAHFPGTFKAAYAFVYNILRVAVRGTGILSDGVQDFPARPHESARFVLGEVAAFFGQPCGVRALVAPFLR